MNELGRCSMRRATLWNTDTKSKAIASSSPLKGTFLILSQPPEMAGASTCGSEDTSQVSIDTIPVEILEKIFSFACDEDCDLALLQTSKSMASKLSRHPVVQCLSILTTCPERDTLFQQKPHRKVTPGFGDPLRYTRPAGSHNQLAQRAWYSNIFVGRLQIALVKRVLQAHWDPLLRRDSHQPSVTSHSYLWVELDEFDKRPTALTTEWMIESRADAVEGRYPWTRVHIWPRQGLVLIRDQLCNHSAQYRIPLLEKMGELLV
jgi:hypothetical protein